MSVKDVGDVISRYRIAIAYSTIVSTVALILALVK